MHIEQLAWARVEAAGVRPAAADAAAVLAPAGLVGDDGGAVAIQVEAEPVAADGAVAARHRAGRPGAPRGPL